MIGVFDSGVGGLSVLREIRRQMPQAALLYVADSAHAPYGDRPADYIEARAASIVRFLLASGARAIVIACNTATVVAARSLRTWCPVPIIAMEPAIKPAVAQTRSGVVGVLATRRTLESASVARLCEMHGGSARILLQPCPGLVDQVERGELASASTRALVRSYVEPLLEQGADTLVLGCTHYPFLLPTIREVSGQDITIVDAAGAVARELTRRVGAYGGSPQAAGQLSFFTSGSPDQARGVLSDLWGDVLRPQVLPEDVRVWTLPPRAEGLQALQGVSGRRAPAG